jgi:GNAT superfamily N-acetyltransferase
MADLVALLYTEREMDGREHRGEFFISTDPSDFDIGAIHA